MKVLTEEALLLYDALYEHFRRRFPFTVSCDKSIWVLKTFYGDVAFE